MRLSIRMLGLELLTLEASTDEDEPEYDTDRDASGGTLYSTPIGFTPRMDVPREDDGRDFE